MVGFLGWVFLGEGRTRGARGWLLLFFFPLLLQLSAFHVFFFHYSAVAKTILRSQDKWLGQVMGLTIYCVYCSESQI